VGPDGNFKSLISLGFSWAYIEDPSRIIPYGSAAGNRHTCPCYYTVLQQIAFTCSS
jgi:hypothetical protein